MTKNGICITMNESMKKASESINEHSEKGNHSATIRRKVE